MQKNDKGIIQILTCISCIEIVNTPPALPTLKPTAVCGMGIIK